MNREVFTLSELRLTSELIMSIEIVGYILLTILGFELMTPLLVLPSLVLCLVLDQFRRHVKKKPWLWTLWAEEHLHSHLLLVVLGVAFHLF